MKRSAPNFIAAEAVRSGYSKSTFLNASCDPAFRIVVPNAQNTSWICTLFRLCSRFSKSTIRLSNLKCCCGNSLLRQHNNLIVLLVSQKIIDEKTADEPSPANNKRFTLHQNIPLKVIPPGAHAYRPTMRSSSSSIVRGQSSFNRRENARSARSLPPVWHRGQ